MSGAYSCCLPGLAVMYSVSWLRTNVAGSKVGPFVHMSYPRAVGQEVRSDKRPGRAHHGGRYGRPAQRWLTRYRAEGLAGLARAPRADRGNRRRSIITGRHARKNQLGARRPTASVDGLRQDLVQHFVTHRAFGLPLFKFGYQGGQSLSVVVT